MKVIYAVIIFNILVVGISFATEDRIFPVKEDGSLEGIPKELRPASLNIEFSLNNKTPITSVTLNLSNNKIRIPKCLTDKLRTKKMDDIEVAGPDYYAKEMPYYMEFEFSEQSHKKSVAFIFNMNDGKMAIMYEKVMKKFETYYGRIDIYKTCSPKELEGFAVDLIELY